MCVVEMLFNGNKENVKDCEYFNRRIDRPTLFELTGLPIAKFHVCNYRGYRRTANVAGDAPSQP